MHTLVEIECVSSFLYTVIKPNITLKSFSNTPIEDGGVDEDTHFTQALSLLNMETARLCD